MLWIQIQFVWIRIQKCAPTLDPDLSRYTRSYTINFERKKTVIKLLLIIKKCHIKNVLTGDGDVLSVSRVSFLFLILIVWIRISNSDFPDPLSC